MLALLLVTVFAVAVMVASGGRWWGLLGQRAEEPTAADNHDELTPAPVAVRRLEQETVELTETWSGMIRPFERFSFAFESAGRIETLGKDDDGADLDLGARVTQGQVLAVLDQRILLARKQEANARLELAQDELRRVRDLHERTPGAVSEVEMRQRETDVIVAQAQAAQTEKELEDATLRSTVDGVISRRFVKPGESVNPRQAVFEVVQVDRLLLVVGVPESRIARLVARQRDIERRRREADRLTRVGGVPDHDREDLVFKTYVTPAGNNVFNPQAQPLIGEVYRIGETSDDKTGLFEVEVLLENREGRLRPGQIALAKIVTDRRTAYRFDSSSAVFRENRAYLYTVQGPGNVAPAASDGDAATANLRARVFELEPGNYVEQGFDLIVFELPPEHRTIVTRGQHRLVDGRPVEIVPDASGNEEPADAAAQTVNQSATLADVRLP